MASKKKTTSTEKTVKPITKKSEPVKSQSIIDAEALVKKEKQETRDAEKALEKAKEKQPELTERQKFHKFYQDVYLKDRNLDEPHHADMHGQLGYETNTIRVEIQSVTGAYKSVEVKGLCELCTIDRLSAREAYENQ